MTADRSTWQYKSIEELMHATDDEILAANKRLRDAMPKYRNVPTEQVPEEFKLLTVWCMIVTIARGLTDRLPKSEK